MTEAVRTAIAASLAAFLPLAGLAATVSVDELCEGMGTVSSLQRSAADGRVSLTLRASAADGFSFSGWTVDGAEPDWGKDRRLPSLTGVLVAADANVRAEFVRPEDDRLEFDVADAFAELVCGESVSLPLEIESASYPTLRFSGLPAGLSFNAQTLSVSGAPSAPGVYVVTVSGKNASGYGFSQTFRSVVGNLSGSRLSGNDAEIPLGAYATLGFDDLFLCDGAVSAVGLTGLPDGLAWNSDWRLVYGTPAKPGTFAVRADVAFEDGAAETATLFLRVAPPAPSEHGVDLASLDDIRVGDVFDAREAEIGSYARSEGVVSVSGLPKGLSVQTWTDGDVRHYGISGMASSAGLYVVSVVVAEFDGDAVTNVATQAEVIVADAPSVYLRTGIYGDSDPSAGTVSGGGAVSIGSRATVSASASRGNVFAGWYDENGEPLQFEGNVDYRTPRITFEAGTDLFVYSLYARFVRSSADGAVAVGNLDGEYFMLSRGEQFDHLFSVQSLSLPTLTFRGLPAGVAYIAEGDGTFSLYYDPSAGVALEPGRYSVSLSAANASHATATAAFGIEVANIVDPRIDVKDDYGAFAPGKAIEAIDLSGAVDFAGGETLSVSGLPRGMTYNRTANPRTGVGAATITGTPTVPGDYTLVFSARVAGDAGTLEQATATAFLRVLPFPGLSVKVADDAAAAGCKVSGTGTYKAGSKVTLRATAAKGWVFAGWRGLGVDGLDAINPKLLYVTDVADVQAQAEFIQVRDDYLFVTEPQPTAAGFSAELAVGVEVSGSEWASLVRDLIETASYPTVRVSGLPPGVRLVQSGFALAGRPTKAGVFYASVEAKNAGGYAFTRVLRIAVAKDGVIPAETPLPNAAAVDFSALSALTTGVWYAEGSLMLPIAANGVSAIRRVAVTGLPAGMKSSSAVSAGGASVLLYGTPGKPGRQTLSVTATYENGKSAKSQFAFTVFDGGSRYLDVASLADDMGTAAGGGVYAAGATVRLAAKAKSGAVFAGWLRADGEPFADMAAIDGIDARTASAAFPFRPGSFGDGTSLLAAFAAKGEDARASISFPGGGTWEIDPTEDSEFALSVDSVSLPKLTVKGLPKGVAADLARGRFVFTANDKVQPGVYAVSVAAKNVSGATAGGGFEIRVANRTCSAILGLDPDMDAYQMTAGSTRGVPAVAPRAAEDGWTLAAKGLPPGLSYRNGVVSGAPSRAGVYTVTFTAAKGAGRDRVVETATITVHVAALPTEATGTFNGFLSGEDGELAGTIAVTATSNGRLSAAVVTEEGKTALSATSWGWEGDAFVAEMSDRKGARLVARLNQSSDWAEVLLLGALTMPDGRQYSVWAQRNAFGAKDGDVDARAAVNSIAGTYRQEDMSLTIRNTGAFTLTGKYEGESVSGTGTLVYNGGFVAKFIKFDKKGRAFVAEARFSQDGGVEINCHWRQIAAYI